LNRTTRRKSPTEIGLAVDPPAVLNDAGEADALVTSMQSAPSGLLRICGRILGSITSRLCWVISREFPDITVNVTQQTAALN
jgi:DNA-binding transcriptional LysR family regulator